MNLVLIRHSKTIIDFNRSNLLWQLSDEGIKRAQELSQKEAIKNLDVVYSSLQTKALQTSLLLAKDNGIPIKTNPDLTEITSFTRKLFKEGFEKNLHNFFTGKVGRLAGGETSDEALARFNQALEDIVSQEKNSQNIGIVSHSCILSFFSAQYYDKEPLDIERNMQMPDVAILNWDAKRFATFFGENLNS